MKIIFCGFLLRLVFAIWVGLTEDTLFIGGDAMAFHKFAENFSINLIHEAKYSTFYYPYFLGYLYYFFTPSLFISSTLSCLVWFFSAFILYRIINLLNFSEINKNYVLLIFTFLPSSILLTSITLREPYQLLFINLSIYFILLFFIYNKKSYFLFFLTSLFFTSFLHRGLAVFSIFFLVFTLFFYFSYLVRILFFPLIMLFGFLIYDGFKDVWNIDLSVGLLKTVENYLTGHQLSRTMYMDKPNFNDIFDFLLFLPESIFKYFFSPFPWQISNFFDLYLLFENTIRFILIYKLIKNIFNYNIYDRTLFTYISFAFIFQEIVWALGTINWGTSIRHHIPAFGLLLIVAFFSKNAKFINKET